MARLTMGLSGLLLATLAIWNCRVGRTTLFVMLSFPLPLSAFASISQDGLAIASGALAVALCSRFLAEDRAMPLPVRAGVSLLLGAVVGARLPLAPLLAILAFETSSSRPWLRPAAIATSGLSLIPVALSVVCASAAKIPFRPQDGVSPSGQCANMLRDPQLAFGALWTTVASHGTEFAREMVSVLGWWSGMVPSSYYGWVAGCLATAVALDVLWPSNPHLGRSRMLVFGAAMMAVLGVFASFYVAWTPVGRAQIEGVQGRYFMVPALTLLLALPRVAWAPDFLKGEMSGRASHLCKNVVCCSVGVFNLWVIPMTILNRYYF